MSDTSATDAAGTVRWQPLDARERRVLGVLIEKAKTTPAAYPMTVNAIVTGCNQKNNREPMSSYDDIDVEQALDVLRNLGVISEIDWMGRVSKYKHHAYEWLGVSRPEMAVMAELLLRGAQPLGDLRGRAARMEPIDDIAALKPIVDALVARGLMVELTPAGRGQVVTHGLHRADELQALRAQFAGTLSPAAPARSTGSPEMPPAARAVMGSGASGAAEPDWRTQIAALRLQVEQLESRVRALEADRGH